LKTNDSNGLTGTARLLQELRHLKADRDQANEHVAEAERMRRSDITTEGAIERLERDAQRIRAASASSLLRLLDDIIVTVEAAEIWQPETVSRGSDAEQQRNAERDGGA
jgi:hypothetical protein